MTPYLAMVLAGYATLMIVLGAVWLRGYVDWARELRAAAKPGEPAAAPELRKAA